MTDTRIALVLGATGGIGGEVARALLQRGWHVRSLNRQPERAVRRAPHLAQVQWVPGDAMRREDVVAAAHGWGRCHRARCQPARLPQLARARASHA